jgi:hypothetical protein
MYYKSWLNKGKWRKMGGREGERGGGRGAMYLERKRTKVRLVE